MSINLHNTTQSYRDVHTRLFVSFVVGNMAVALSFLFTVLVLWIRLGDPTPQLPVLGYTGLVELLLVSFGATAWAVGIAAVTTVQQLPGRHATRWLVVPYAICFVTALAIFVAVSVSR